MTSSEILFLVSITVPFRSSSSESLELLEFRDSLRLELIEEFDLPEGLV